MVRYDLKHFRPRRDKFISRMMIFTFVVGGLFNFFPFVEVPVMRLRIPGFGEEFNDIWGGHLGNGFPEEEEKS